MALAMGEPAKIVDFAKRMIHLSGVAFTPSTFCNILFLKLWVWGC